MIDPQRLLEQVLGGNLDNLANGAGLRGVGRDLKNRLDQTSGSSAFAGGALAGGLLGLLLGGNKLRKLTGGVLGYGGAAALGALALQAYQNYQRRQGASAAYSSAEVQAPHVRPAANGGPFELALIRAMVGAAKADGHIDAAEQRRLLAEVERIGLDAEAKAYVFDLLTHDVDVDSLVGAVATPEQGAELYLAARLAIDPDELGERAFLDALASRLNLPPELRAMLDAAPESK